MVRKEPQRRQRVLGLSAQCQISRQVPRQLTPARNLPRRRSKAALHRHHHHHHHHQAMHPRAAFASTSRPIIRACLAGTSVTAPAAPKRWLARTVLSAVRPSRTSSKCTNDGFAVMRFSFLVCVFLLRVTVPRAHCCVLLTFAYSIMIEERR